MHPQTVDMWSLILLRTIILNYENFLSHSEWEGGHNSEKVRLFGKDQTYRNMLFPPK